MLDTDERRPALERARLDLAAMQAQLSALLATHETDEPATRWDDADDDIQYAIGYVEDALQHVEGALAYDPLA